MVENTLFQDQKGNQSFLGVNYSGILVFMNNRKVNHYRWNEVQKVNYEGKMFIVHLVYMEVCCAIRILRLHPTNATVLLRSVT